MPNMKPYLNSIYFMRKLIGRLLSLADIKVGSASLSKSIRMAEKEIKIGVGAFCFFHYIESLDT